MSQLRFLKDHKFLKETDRSIFIGRQSSCGEEDKGKEPAEAELLDEQTGQPRCRPR